MASRESGSARPALSLDAVPAQASGGVTAAVLLLHGGRSQDRSRPPSALSLPAARMVPFGRAVARATAGHGVALGRVRYRYRGWNDEHADAAQDARRALDELAERLGPVPVVLVGHSMGGRAALRVADHPSVRGVVGLAPWCPLEDPVAQLDGRSVVLLHCPTDRVTDARGSWELVHRARARGTAACGIAMPRGRHAMLRGAADWHRLTTSLVTGLLGITALPEPVARELAPDAAAVPAAENGRIAFADVMA